MAGTARALGIKVSTLYGTHENEVLDEPSQQSAGVADLRSALDAYDDPRPEGHPLTLDAVNARLASASDQVLALRHAEVLSDLPDLSHHLYILADQPGRVGEQGRGALHDAYRISATVAGRFRQADLAAIASERHIQLAPRTGDPLRIAISAYHRSTRYLQHGDYRNGLRLLDCAREHVGVSATDPSLGQALDAAGQCRALRGLAGLPLRWLAVSGRNGGGW
ncbi:hypothetical protein F9C11_40625 [Amycolatopsis sp. VS8301801F10]|uniref:hypothetical protein n=1 Tax=Amycolatopsis sp. VS8301801F10 TaxID=2652442 RepID=UPI0038FC72D4